MINSSSFQDLRIWQEAMDLTEQVYRATSDFPRQETYGLTSQMRRAAVSVPSNIAEGKGHRSDPEFVRFLFHARGSLLELQTQILIARRLKYLSEEKTDELSSRGDSIARGLNALINKFRAAGMAGRDGSDGASLSGQRFFESTNSAQPQPNDQRPTTIDQRLHHHTLHAF
jgi:four helix bundle protein